MKPLLVPIIKADAYGHGSALVGREALRSSVISDGVTVPIAKGVGFATIEETVYFLDSVRKIDPDCLANKFALLMGLSRLLKATLHGHQKENESTHTQRTCWHKKQWERKSM